MGEHRYTPVLPWVAKIKYGPNGEAEYAWVSANDGTLIGTFKRHHADLVIRAVNRDPLFNEAVEALDKLLWKVAWEAHPSRPLILRHTTEIEADDGAFVAAERARAILSKIKAAQASEDK